jgi:hypothetical protein
MPILDHIKYWLKAATYGIDVSDELIEHGHALAAAYQLPNIRLGRGGRIMAAAARTMPGDEMIAAGLALSSLMTSECLDRSTDFDNPLRRGFAFCGWNDGSQTAADCRNAADATARLAAARYVNEVSEDDDGVADGIDRLLSVLRCAEGKPDFKIDAVCIKVADDLIHPEIALLIVMHTLSTGSIEWAKSIRPRAAEAIAAAFERQQPSVLPPVIV